MAQSSGGILRELIAVFGFGVDTSDLKKGETELDRFYGRIKKLATGLAGLFAIHEIAAFANAQAALLDKLDDTSAALGITTERTQQLRFASKALGDAADTLLNLTGRLQVAQQAAAQGGQAQAKAFSTIGVNVRDANGHFKQADDLLLDVADALSKVKDPSKAAAVATELFGRGGRVLLPFLKEGRKGLQGLFEEYKQLGGGYTQKAIAAGAEYQKGTAKLDLSLDGLKSTILVKLFPALGVIVKWMTKGIVAIRELSQRSNILTGIMVVLGGVATIFAIKMAIAAAPLLLMAAALAVLVLQVDDFVTMLRGGDSLIGRVIDRMFGKDAHVAVVRELKELWGDVKAIFEGLGVVIGPIWDFFKWIVANIKDLADAMQAFDRLQADEDKHRIAANKKRIEKWEKEGTVYRAPDETAAQAAGEFAELAKRGALPGVQAMEPPAFTRAQGPEGQQHTESMVQIGELHVHGAEGMNTRELAEHTAKAIDKRINARNRAAAATFQRKNPSK